MSDVEVRTDHGWVRRQLPLVLVVTASVVLLPPFAVTLLFPDVSLVLGVALCMFLSLAVSRVLAILWQRLPRSRDVLFVDLLVWGWIRRVRTERRLACAAELLAQDKDGAPDGTAAHIRELERISAMVELRDGYTHRHSLRVTRHCEAMACELGLPESDIARVRTAAALHDVGKYYTPRSILNKPDRLTDAEFDVIKRHPGRGAVLLEGVVTPDTVAMIRHHHERLDGGGYPDGLIGDQIPLGARIIAVADTFDAMTSNRAYRSARSHQRALDVLCDEAGVALDARCVDAFRAYYSGRRGVYWSNLFSGLGLGLTSAREFLVPSALAHALPAIGASAALTVPMLSGSGLGAAGASDAPVPRSGESPGHSSSATPTPTPTPTSAPSPMPAKKPKLGRPDAFDRIRTSLDESSQAHAAAVRPKETRSRGRGDGSNDRQRASPRSSPEPPPAPTVPGGAPGDGAKPKPKPPKPKPAKPNSRKPTQPQAPANPSNPPGNPSIDLPDPPHEGPPGNPGRGPH